MLFLKKLGLKSLATIVCGRFVAPYDWKKQFRNNAMLTPDNIRLFLLQQCQFRYIVNSVKSSKLYSSSQQFLVPMARHARRAAEYLSDSGGVRAATTDAHTKFAEKFNKTYNVLVKNKQNIDDFNFT
jgi:hypothetical protein